MYCNVLHLLSCKYDEVCFWYYQYSAGNRRCSHSQPSSKALLASISEYHKAYHYQQRLDKTVQLAVSFLCGYYQRIVVTNSEPFMTASYAVNGHYSRIVAGIRASAINRIVKKTANTSTISNNYSRIFE